MLTLCLFSCGGGASTPDQVFQKAADEGFSGAVLVRHRGEIVLHDASGMANRELGLTNTTDTIFQMGSITKQFTGALILVLQEAGLLRVSDRLADHLEGVPEDKADITIHQLLTHTAGFETALGRDPEPLDREAFLALVWATPLVQPPGRAYRYSNVGYSIAAAIAETVTGQGYEALLNERVLTPANMMETGSVIPDWSDRTIAVGYQGEFSLAPRSIWGDEGPYWNLLGNGGLLTTTNDLLKWHDALSMEAVLNADSISLFQGRHADVADSPNNQLDAGRTFYGYGWRTIDTPAGIVLTHSGSNGLHFSNFARFTEEDLIIIVHSNAQNPASVELSFKLAASILPELVRPSVQ